MSDKRKFFLTKANSYCSEDYWTLAREFGRTLNGTEINGSWVLRNEKGEWVDFSQYRVDLMERNKFEIDTFEKRPKKEEKLTCGITTFRDNYDMISGHIEFETLTLCGNDLCSDECWQNWEYCPYCGKKFEVHLTPKDPIALHNSI
jgi:hypothetical protein